MLGCFIHLITGSVGQLTWDPRCRSPRDAEPANQLGPPWSSVTVHPVAEFPPARMVLTDGGIRHERRKRRYDLARPSAAKLISLSIAGINFGDGTSRKNILSQAGSLVDALNAIRFQLLSCLTFEDRQTHSWRTSGTQSFSGLGRRVVAFQLSKPGNYAMGGTSRRASDWRSQAPGITTAFLELIEFGRPMPECWLASDADRQHDQHQVGGTHAESR